MKNIIVLLCTLVVFTSCSTFKKSSEKKDVVVSDNSGIDKLRLTVPKWYLYPPKSSSSKTYATSSGTSTQLQMALDKAVLNAKYALAAQMKSNISGTNQSLVTEDLARQARSVINYSKSVKRELVRDIQLSGLQIEKTEIKRDAGIFRVYVLLSKENTSKNVSEGISNRMSDVSSQKLEREIKILDDDIPTKTYPVD